VHFYYPVLCRFYYDNLVFIAWSHFHRFADLPVSSELVFGNRRSGDTLDHKSKKWKKKWPNFLKVWSKIEFWCAWCCKKQRLKWTYNAERIIDLSPHLDKMIRMHAHVLSQTFFEEFWWFSTTFKGLILGLIALNGLLYSRKSSFKCVNYTDFCTLLWHLVFDENGWVVNWNTKVIY